MLTPEGKLGLALTTTVLIYGIFQLNMPPAVDVRTVESGNEDVQASERTATWTAAIAVTGISLLAKSPEVFTVGGIVLVGMAWTYRHADQVSPLTKKATGFLTPDQLAKTQMPDAAAATEPVSSHSYSAVI